MAGKPFFGKKLPDGSVDTLGIKNFTKITLSRTVFAFFYAEIQDCRQKLFPSEVQPKCMIKLKRWSNKLLSITNATILYNGRTFKTCFMQPKILSLNKGCLSLMIILFYLLIGILFEFEF